MVFPTQREVELPLLEEIEAMGGQAEYEKLLPKVALHFSQITEHDLGAKVLKGQYKGQNQWKMIVKGVRTGLSGKGELLAQRGIWQITDKGRAGLKREGSEVEPVLVSPLPPIDEVDGLVQEIKSLTEKLAELAKKGKEEALPTHDEMVQKVKEMGERLGKIAELKWGPKLEYDCVWKDNPFASPKLVIEVCDKGNLYKDFTSLEWAVTTWGAKGILVIFDDSDFHKAQEMLVQKIQIYPVKADDMLKLHSSLQAGNIQAFRSIVAA